jgi:hypothetical protein
MAQIFGQGVEQKVTVVLETTEAEEEEADNIDFVVLCEEIEALERRVKVQGMHIQQIRLETEGEYQPKERLEEAGNTPAGEMAEAKLSKGEAEQQLSEETAKLESAAEWQDKATGDGEDYKGDRVDLPICKEEVQQKRLHKESQPLEQLDEVIEKIRRLMSGQHRSNQQEEVEQRRTCHSSRDAAAAATAKQWSGWTAPEESLGSRWISTAMLGSS